MNTCSLYHKWWHHPDILKHFHSILHKTVSGISQLWRRTVPQMFRPQDMKTPVSTGREGRRLGGGQEQVWGPRQAPFHQSLWGRLRVCSFFKFTLSSFGDAWGRWDRGRERKRKQREEGRRQERTERRGRKEKYPKYPSWRVFVRLKMNQNV